VGRHVPRPSRVSWAPTLGTHPSRAALADRGPDRGCEGRGTHQGQLPGRDHAQLRGRRGEAKAIGATRHDILVAYYYIVRDQVPFRELGPDWQRKRSSPEHRARRLQRQLEALGYQVTLSEAPATA
jgi:hypothetical protein